MVKRLFESIDGSDLKNISNTIKGYTIKFLRYGRSVGDNTEISNEMIIYDGNKMIVSITTDEDPNGSSIFIDSSVDKESNLVNKLYEISEEYDIPVLTGDLY